MHYSLWYAPPSKRISSITPFIFVSSDAMKAPSQPRRAPMLARHEPSTKGAERSHHGGGSLELGSSVIVCGRMLRSRSAGRSPPPYANRLRTAVCGCSIRVGRTGVRRLWFVVGARQNVENSQVSLPTHIVAHRYM